MPLTIRYMWALRRHARQGHLQHLDILDFHRIEPLALFMKDSRPKNVMIHQDMEVIRNKNADIGWRHAPWLYEFIERRLLRTADHFFCVRQSAVARYKTIYADLANKFSFIPTWADTTVFHPLYLVNLRSVVWASRKRQLVNATARSMCTEAVFAH